MVRDPETGLGSQPSPWLKVTILSTMLADEGIGEWGFAALVEADGRQSVGYRGPTSRPLPRRGSRLASRRLGVVLGVSLGKRCGTSLVGPGPPLAVGVFLLPIRGATVMGRLHPFEDDISSELCSAPCLNTLCLLSCRLVRIAGWISVGVPPPFVKRRKEIVEGILFWPEIARKVAWVAGKLQSLFLDQLSDCRMPFADVFFSQSCPKSSSNPMLPARRGIVSGPGALGGMRLPRYDQLSQGWKKTHPIKKHDLQR